MALPAPETDWHETVKDKREIYSKRYRIAVGGKSDDGRKPSKRLDSMIEPVFFFTLPLAFYEEIIHLYFCKTIFDMTPGQGTFGEAAIRNRVGYYGLAMSERHAQALEERFRMAALRYMCEEGSPVYSPMCAETFGVGAAAKAAPKAAPKAGKPAHHVAPKAPGGGPPMTTAGKGGKGGKGQRKKGNGGPAAGAPTPPASSTPLAAPTAEPTAAGGCEASDWDFSDGEEPDTAA